MKVLVTGAAGFIGSHIVDKCLERGYEVHGIDDLSTGRIENVDKRCELIIDNILNCDFEKVFGKVDVIFHTAALARIQPSFKQPIKYESVNVIGTLRLLEYALQVKSKFIFSSSSSVYGVKNRLSFPMDEKHSLNPSSPYALQKRFCEQYIELYGKSYDLKYTIFRYFNVYGPRQIMDGAYAAVVGIFLDQYKNGRNFTIYGNGLQRRDFTFVKDVADVNVRAAESGVSEGIFNIGTGVNHSVLDVANYISRDSEITYFPERPGEALETLADNRLARTTFNWNPSTKLNEWIYGEAIRTRV